MSVTRKSGSDKGFVRRDISATAFSVGDILAYDRSNHIVVAASATTTVEDLAGICVEATTTADTSILLQEIVEGDKYIATTTNNSNANHNYQRMIIGANAGTINNTGTDSTNDAAVFMQEGVIGAAADKKIIGRFMLRQDRA